MKSVKFIDLDPRRFYAQGQGHRGHEKFLKVLPSANNLSNN